MAEAVRCSSHSGRQHSSSSFANRQSEYSPLVEFHRNCSD